MKRYGITRVDVGGGRYKEPKGCCLEVAGVGQKVGVVLQWFWRVFGVDVGGGGIRSQRGVVWKWQEWVRRHISVCFLSPEEPKRVHQALKDPSWIEAIRLFLTYASFIGFMVYQMDVKSAFLYGNIKEDVYVCQPPGFEDPDHPDKVYKVVKALYGLHQAPKAWYETLATYLLENDDIIFGATNKDLCKSFEKLMKDKLNIGELTFFLGLQVKKKKDGIFISQDKYVVEVLRKFGLTKGKSASTPIDTNKPLLKDPDGEDVDVHAYKSMIGSLMYLTSSRPDIMFACKKQTVVATSSTEAEYVAATSCCAQVLWIQNQLLDYGLKVKIIRCDNGTEFKNSDLNQFCRNNNKDAHADGKEHDDDIQKSVSPNIHSLSSGAQTRKQDDKTENKDKDNTNDFSAAGPSNAVMPNLEDLSHDADDV
nr:putative ribonuclease H-like domain-containing protein [Tanacetum cinerariifolium]